jgi:hypothetical protein
MCLCLCLWMCLGFHVSFSISLFPLILAVPSSGCHVLLLNTTLYFIALNGQIIILLRGKISKQIFLLLFLRFIFTLFL